MIVKCKMGIALLGLIAVGSAWGENQEQLLTSGPMTNSIPMPDPTHLPVVFAKDIKWTEGPVKGEFQAPLFGDPSKPGIYGVLIKWAPGANSTPHFHTTDRYIYVVSGTWWVSSSTTHDTTKMYPVPAGSFVTDIKNTIHWDGSTAQSKEPCVLLLVGEGPMKTVRYVPKGSGSMEYGPEDKK